jgi:hypothetical protein
MTSTGGASSKFGIGVDTQRAELIDAYKQRPWLSMVHVHVGSQGIPLESSKSIVSIASFLSPILLLSFYMHVHVGSQGMLLGSSKKVHAITSLRSALNP